MNESAKYEGYKKKLDGICDENDLIYTLNTKTYPITLTIRPLQGVAEQMSMLEMADEKPFNSPDASIVFFVKDGDLIYKMSERFTIGDALFGKIRNLFRNLHATYLQMFHRDVTEKDLLRQPYAPTAPTDTNEPYEEPLEEYEEDEDEGDATETPDFPDDMLEEDNDG